MRSVIVFALIYLTPLLLLAQPGDPGGGNPSVPITGIEYLIGGGLLLGIKKIYSNIKSKKE